MRNSRQRAEGSEDLHDVDGTLLSPTLARRTQLLEAMIPRPICTACPAAQWYELQGSTGEQALECFCTKFRAVMYSERSRAVTACDAREDAIRESQAQWKAEG